MTPIYDAENIIDAHLVVHLLVDSGIAAHVFGSPLAGAVGELPAAGLIRVWIEDDAQAEVAVAIVRDWSAAPVADVDELERLADDGTGEGYVLA